MPKNNKSDNKSESSSSSSSGGGYKYNKNERNWTKPSKRAKQYVDERKARVHQGGPKDGKELTPTEATFRSGYLQCQSDHAGMYKFVTALKEGKTVEEATAISRQRGNKN